MTQWNLGDPVCPLCKERAGFGHVCTNVPSTADAGSIPTFSGPGFPCLECKNLTSQLFEARRERDELREGAGGYKWATMLLQAEERGARSAFEYKRRRYEAHNETVLQRMVDADMTEWRKRNGKGGGDGGS